MNAYPYKIEGYRIGRPYYNESVDKETINWKHAKLADRGKKTYIDAVIKESKKPGRIGPQQYSKILDWQAEGSNPRIHGHALKDRFYPGKRETISAEISRLEKERKSPSPDQYKNMP